MSVLSDLYARREALKSEIEASAKVTDEESGEIRSMTEDEKSAWSAKVTEVRELDETIHDLEEAEKREIASAKHRLEMGAVEQRVSVVNEPNPVYRADDTVRSFFKDMAAVQLNKRELLGPNNGTVQEARERLVKSQETRAGDMTTAAGAGGEFAPPEWLISEFVALARPGRVTADLMNHNVLPGGVSSINLPKVAGGSATAVQQTQNSNLQDTAMTTTSASSGITTVGGGQIVAMQLLQQSGIPFDRVILQDLAADYAVQVDKQVLYGTGANGQVKGLSSNATTFTWTTASPAVASSTVTNSLYYQVSKAVAAVQAAIFLPADTIIMHPRRWAWIAGSADGQNRPFVVPTGQAYNPAGTGTLDNAQGSVGTFAGLPVFTDPSIVTNLNGTNAQDEIYVLRRGEQYLYETAVQSASFDATFAQQASVYFRVLGYIAFLANRRPATAIQRVDGTGLSAPA